MFRYNSFRRCFCSNYNNKELESQLKEFRKTKSVTDAKTFLKQLSDIERIAIAQSIFTPQMSERLFNIGDKNKDGQLDISEFKELVSKRTAHWAAIAEGARHSTIKRELTESKSPTNEQLFKLMIRTGVPFIGFGFLDNAIMIIAGDYIDHTLGLALGITTMAAAGLGNAVSDVFGIGLSGAIDAAANKIGLPKPNLSAAQSEMTITRVTSTFSSALGIAIGCLLGMLPLLVWIGDKDNEMDFNCKKLVKTKRFKDSVHEIFTSIDRDGNGYIDASELNLAYRSLLLQFFNFPGDINCLEFNQTEIKRILKKYDTNGDGGLVRSNSK